MPICQQPDVHLLLAQALHMRLASGGLHNQRRALIIYMVCAEQQGRSR